MSATVESGGAWGQQASGGDPDRRAPAPPACEIAVTLVEALVQQDLASCTLWEPEPTPAIEP